MYLRDHFEFPAAVVPWGLRRLLECLHFSDLVFNLEFNCFYGDISLTLSGALPIDLPGERVAPPAWSSIVSPFDFFGDLF